MLDIEFRLEHSTELTKFDMVNFECSVHFFRTPWPAQPQRKYNQIEGWKYTIVACDDVLEIGKLLFQF